MPMEHSMEARALKTGYDSRVIIDDVNVEIPMGKVSVILGSNGCGKSTLLKTFCRLNRIFDGEILLDGKKTDEIAPKEFACTVGLMPQSPLVPEGITVYDLVSRGRFPYRKFMRGLGTEDFQAVKDALEMMEIADMADRPVDELSGGQRQRVAMGRAIVRSPKVFLMDEPLSNLDAKLRVQMRSEIASLHNRLKATIIYVTHDQTEAMTLGTRIVVLKDGVIMQVDSPQKLYNEPNNLFVAGFIGSPQMNFIDAVCKVEGERVTLNFEKTSVVLPPAKAKKLIDGGYNGKTVVMGIRPEDIGDSQIEIEAHKDAVFETDVTGYELLGSEVLLYFNVAGTAMTAKVDSRTTARMGDHITLAIDPEKIHCFDKETELTITN